MNKPRLLLASLAALLLFAALPAPQVSALGGTPPTLQCTNTFAPSLGGTLTRSADASTRELDVDASSNAYLTYTEIAGGFAKAFLVKVNTGCTTQWAQSVTDAADSVTTSPLRVDLAGRLYHGTIDSNDDLLNVRSGTTGATVTEGPDLDGLGITQGSLRGVDSRNVSSTSLAYFAVANQRFFRFSQDFLTTTFDVGLPEPNPQTIYVDTASDFTFITTGTGANNRLLKMNSTTGGTVTTAVPPGTQELTSGERISLKGQSNKTRVYHWNSEGTSGSTTLAYDAIRISDWSFVVSAQAFTPNQINDAGLRDTNVLDWDIDGADNMLICGNYAVGAEDRGFIAHMKTSNNTMFWNVTIDAGQATTVDQCRFDFNGGFYAALTTTDGAGVQRFSVRHYTGGGFTPPTVRGTVTIAGATPTPTAITVDAGTGIKNFATNVGFREAPSQFLFGVILVAIASYATFAALQGVKLGRAGSVWAAGFIGLGVGIFNAQQGIWPEFFIIVAIAFAAAVGAWLVRKNTLGG